MEVEEEEEREEKQNPLTERPMELTQGEVEGEDLPIFKHLSHYHSLVLRESLQGCSNYDGGRVQVYCDGCGEPISSSSSEAREGGRAFYACPESNCSFLLHKRCAKLPLKIEHPTHPEHALTLRPFPFHDHKCDVCRSRVSGFIYRCSECDFDVHVRCASMALHIQDRVDENNEIHRHSLIPIDMEVQFLCTACGIEHEGKSYLCPTCGFWANQICASAPSTVDLQSHPHPLALFRPASRRSGNCKICNKKVKRARWAYFCSKGCRYSVHVGCWLSLEVENSNKDIQASFPSESPSPEIEIPTDFKENWPLSGESGEVITQLIKNFNSQETHKRATKIFCCRKGHQLIDASKDDQQCDGCAQTISSHCYHCPQCNFSLHEWCVELPNELQHILHPEPPLHFGIQKSLFCLIMPQKQNIYFPYTYCHNCYMPTNGFFFSCSTCEFCLDLKCALLPRLIKHQAHHHNLTLRMVTDTQSCNACGVDCVAFLTSFRCETCNFGVCIKCSLLPFSISHKYDDHPFTLTYHPVKGQPNDYYCEICEEDIDSMFWFYHCVECDQSLHPECIYPIEKSMNVKFGVPAKHSPLLRYVRQPKARVSAPCDVCGSHFKELDYMAYECEQHDIRFHTRCLKYALRTKQRKAH